MEEFDFDAPARRLFDDALDRLLRLVREDICATTSLVGETIVADGELGVDGETRVGSLTIAGTALAESLRHHPAAATAAGAVLSDVEEALQFAALDGGAIPIAIG